MLTVTPNVGTPRNIYFGKNKRNNVSNNVARSATFDSIAQSRVNRNLGALNGLGKLARKIALGVTTAVATLTGNAQSIVWTNGDSIPANLPKNIEKYMQQNKSRINNAIITDVVDQNNDTCKAAVFWEKWNPTVNEDTYIKLLTDNSVGAPTNVSQMVYCEPNIFQNAGFAGYTVANRKRKVLDIDKTERQILKDMPVLQADSLKQSYFRQGKYREKILAEEMAFRFIDNEGSEYATAFAFRTRANAAKMFNCIGRDQLRNTIEMFLHIK